MAKTKSQVILNQRCPFSQMISLLQNAQMLNQLDKGDCLIWGMNIIRGKKLRKNLTVSLTEIKLCTYNLAVSHIAIQMQKFSNSGIFSLELQLLTVWVGKRLQVAQHGGTCVFM